MFPVLSPLGLVLEKASFLNLSNVVLPVLPLKWVSRLLEDSPQGSCLPSLSPNLFFIYNVRFFLSSRITSAVLSFTKIEFISFSVLSLSII